jgi:hypothetical protein
LNFTDEWNKENTPPVFKRIRQKIGRDDEDFQRDLLDVLEKEFCRRTEAEAQITANISQILAETCAVRLEIASLVRLLGGGKGDA